MTETHSSEFVLFSLATTHLQFVHLIFYLHLPWNRALYTIHESSCFVFRVSLFVYFNTWKYITKGLGKYAGTRKYIKRGFSVNTGYTKYRTIGFIRIHDYTQKFRWYTNIEMNELRHDHFSNINHLILWRPSM